MVACQEEYSNLFKMQLCPRIYAQLYSCYLSNNDLVFAKDHRDEEENSYKNYYNLYLSQNGKVTSVTQELMDLQQLRCYNDKIYVQAFNLGRPQILVFEKDHLTNGFKKKSIEIDPVSFLTPVPSKNKLYLAATYSKAPSQIIEFNLDSHNTKMIKISTSLNVDEENISEGQMIIFPTTDGKLSYGYFYPPVNKNFCAAPGEQPPVRVLIHGGPTGMTTLGFSKKLMFWTSQGYAVFDVNYRGSFGFGRKYRDALLNNWGILEIQDVKDGLAELRQQKLIGDKAVVSGGSAGGYTVQRLLTFYPDMFAAGASHFGIGNLITLQKLTHKFEIHYLEQLIGGTLETNLKEYEKRSPINHLVNLKSPMIIFQGSDDKVVAPENSREIASILKRKGIRYEYYEYEGEGHGFRKKENLVNSLIKESNFFKSVLSSTDK